MNYNTYPYGIFNPQYLSQFQAQEMEAQRNLEQQKISVTWSRRFLIFARQPEKWMPITSRQL